MATSVRTFLADFPPNLGFEATAGQHYMLIDSYESTNAVTTAEGQKLSSVGLYIPAGSLTTSYTGNYEGKEGAATAARMGGTFGGSPSDERSVTDKISDFASSLSSTLGSKVAAAADSTGFISAQGLTPNNHMALVYKGPNSFRQHTFAFKFFPKNEKESETVKKIIAEFRFGTLPRMNSGGLIKDAFFKSPRHHKIRFCQGGSGADGAGSSNGYLFEIGMSVITNMAVNYDPQSVVSFHKDGQPVEIDMSLTFQEIELQINTKDSIYSGQGRDALVDATADSQNQSSSQTTSEQQAVQRDANLASLGGQNKVNPRLG
jgi:hypothetical protein